MNIYDDHRKLADDAANKTAERIFLLFGVDLTNKEEVAEFRDRMDFNKRMYRGALEVKRATIKTCVGALVSGLIAILVLGFHQWLGRS